ncbi:unnamed protein product [Vitrella brassicaformis CCMP3155]|uniref:Cytochrome P450 n=1 Tax=Vitrella brassicaformis (strain CCMP3155) TaxID=1169540 RepID=A0A0G4EL79_VITBC|nr:unnamed protein product [Vitrella brassicaformis CCMP3155]|eukprot:CEL98166.1 unnamed protein product [Vitrella brassicaformis CCMP3155]
MENALTSHLAPLQKDRELRCKDLMLSPLSQISQRIWNPPTIMPVTADLEQPSSLLLLAGATAGVVCLIGLEEVLRLRNKAANASSSSVDGKPGGRPDVLRHVTPEEKAKLCEVPRVKLTPMEAFDALRSGKDPHLQEKWRDELDSDVFYVQLPLNKRMYFCTDTSCWDTLLGPDGLEKSHVHRLLDLFGEGQMTRTRSLLSRKTSGEGWHAIRKALAPAFSNKTLVAKTHIYHRVLGSFVKALEDAADKGTIVNMPEWGLRYTIDMIGEVAYNYKFHAFDDERNGEAKALLRGLDVIFRETRYYSTHFVCVCVCRPYMVWKDQVREYYQSIRLFRDVCRKIYRQYLDTPPEKQDAASIISYIHNNPGYQCEFEKLCDIYTLLWAGHDTTGYTISWAVYHLSSNPPVLKKLQQELDAAKFAEELPSYDELAQLPYFNACVKEIMRISPVVSNGTRRQTESGFKVTSRGVDYWIPGGYQMFVPLFARLRDDRIWGDGKVFRPERWLEASEEQLKVYNKLFQPFSIAPRSCIAQHLALIEVRMTIAALFKRYEFEITTEPEFFYSITYKPRGLMVKPIKRS